MPLAKPNQLELLVHKVFHHQYQQNFRPGYSLYLIDIKYNVPDNPENAETGKDNSNF